LDGLPRRFLNGFPSLFNRLNLALNPIMPNPPALRHLREDLPGHHCGIGRSALINLGRRGRRVDRPGIRLRRIGPVDGFHQRDFPMKGKEIGRRFHFIDKEERGADGAQMEQSGRQPP
jgi:hypothetical protein